MVAAFAVQALKRGQNPYAWDFSDMLRAYRDQGAFITPLLDGTYQHRVTYPALPTLLLAGLDVFGLGQPRLLSFISQMALVCLLYMGAPARLRPLALLPLLALQDFTTFTLSGIQDVVWSMLLVAMILAWRRPIWRAILYGLACAFRQQPWLIAPFLLIDLWHEPGAARDKIRRLLLFAAISGGTFLLINLPFIIWDAHAWWLGAFEPAYAIFNVYSQGLSVITQYGLAALPRSFYTFLQFSTYLLLLVVHWRHPRWVGRAFWIFPAIFFWLYYRSLASYWVYWLPPLLCAIGRDFKGLAGGSRHAGEAPQRWAGTAGLALALLFANGAAAWALLQRPPSIEAAYALPLETVDYGTPLVGRLHVGVTNRGATALLPRFAVQHDPGTQALPWAIESGPESLAPGESGRYIINALIAARMFPASEGGQIVITDASGDYSRRRVVTVPPDLSFTRPQAIANPGFVYWPGGGRTPAAWSLALAPARAAGGVRLGARDGRLALIFNGQRIAPAEAATTIRLGQSIVLPDELALWVYPPRNADDPASGAYGLELDDGQRKLWVLFGESDRHGWLENGLAYVYLRAPLGRWSRQIIHPADLYRLVGWDQPAPSLRSANGLQFAARQVRLSLIAVIDSLSESEVVFGTLQPGPAARTPSELAAEALAQPEIYYANLGDEYRRQRNYSLAVETYQRGLSFNADSPENFFGLGESNFWLGNYPEAIAAFQRSAAHGHRTAEAYRGVGWSYYALSQWEAARAAFEAATQADPSLADAFNGLGWAWLRLGQCRTAMPYFAQALHLSPEFPEPQRGLAECRSGP
jgi:tetratricopeptide (TPR) repeat protein